MKQFVILVSILLAAVIVVACASPTPTVVPTVAPAPPKASVPTQTPVAAPVLKLEGLGSVKSLTMDDLKAMPVAQGWAGIKSSTGRITIPEQYKGVSVTDLC